MAGEVEGVSGQAEASELNGEVLHHLLVGRITMRNKSNTFRLGNGAIKKNGDRGEVRAGCGYPHFDTLQASGVTANLRQREAEHDNTEQQQHCCNYKLHSSTTFGAPPCACIRKDMVVSKATL